jgi:C1A family cysteine protease
MKTTMKKLFQPKILIAAYMYVCIAMALLNLSSCKKDDPTAVVPPVTTITDKEKFPTQQIGVQLLDAATYQAIPQLAIPTGKLRTTEILPTLVDLAPEMPPVGNQGGQGSCVGWSSTYALRSYLEHVVKKTAYLNADGTPNQSVLFSPAYTYNSLNGGADNGLQINNAMNFLLNDGAIPLSVMPYNDKDFLTKPTADQKSRAAAYKLKSWGRVPITLDAMRAFLAYKNPLVIGMTVDGNMTSGTEKYGAEAGWKTYNPATERGGHAMIIVGYDDAKQAFKVQNSWGENWGNKGFFWLSYDLLKYIREVYAAAIDGKSIDDPIKVINTPVGDQKITIDKITAISAAGFVLSYSHLNANAPNSNGYGPGDNSGNSWQYQIILSEKADPLITDAGIVKIPVYPSAVKVGNPATITATRVVNAKVAAIKANTTYYVRVYHAVSSATLGGTVLYSNTQSVKLPERTNSNSLTIYTAYSKKQSLFTPYNDKVYGYAGSSIGIQASYNLTTNTWENYTDESFIADFIATEGGKQYTFGYSSKDALYFEEHDIVSKTTKKLTTTTETGYLGVTSQEATVKDKKLYTLATNKDATGKFVTKALMYDIDKATWTTLADAPTELGLTTDFKISRLEIHGNTLVVLSEANNKKYTLDLSTNKWTTANFLAYSGTFSGISAYFRRSNFRTPQVIYANNERHTYVLVAEAVDYQTAPPALARFDHTTNTYEAVALTPNTMVLTITMWGDKLVVWEVNETDGVLKPRVIN